MKYIIVTVFLLVYCYCSNAQDYRPQDYRNYYILIDLSKTYINFHGEKIPNYTENHKTGERFIKEEGRKNIIFSRDYANEVLGIIDKFVYNKKNGVKRELTKKEFDSIQFSMVRELHRKLPMPIMTDEDVDADRDSFKLVGTINVVEMTKEGKIFLYEVEWETETGIME